LAFNLRSGAPAHIISEFSTLLQYHLSTYLSSDYALPQQNTNPITQSIFSRLNGSKGRIRGNLLGKNVNFIGISTITADPNLSLDEVGIPRSMAMKLTLTETLCAANKRRY